MVYWQDYLLGFGIPAATSTDDDVNQPAGQPGLLMPARLRGTYCDRLRPGPGPGPGLA